MWGSYVHIVWCRLGDGATDYVEGGSSYVMRWRMKFNSRKRKIMVVRESEGGTELEN